MNNAAYLIAAIAILVGVPNGIPAAHAETVTLKADLKGSNEVPPNNSPASGTAEAKFDTDTKLLSWNITFAGLTGPVVGRSLPWSRRGRKERRDRAPVQDRASPIEGTATLTESPDGRPARGQVVRQHSHRGPSRRRTARPDDEVIQSEPKDVRRRARPAEPQPRRRLLICELPAIHRISQRAAAARQNSLVPPRRRKRSVPGPVRRFRSPRR